MRSDRGGRSCTSRSGWLVVAVAATLTLGLVGPAGASTQSSDGSSYQASEGWFAPHPPRPEPIKVPELPLPPTAPTAADGSVVPGGCAHPTGCISPADSGIQEG